LLLLQVVSAVNGPALDQQTRLVAAAKEAGTIKQFVPSEFSAFGAIGALLKRRTIAETPM
jgi:hypothetical protein